MQLLYLTGNGSLDHQGNGTKMPSATERCALDRTKQDRSFPLSSCGLGFAAIPLHRAVQPFFEIDCRPVPELLFRARNVRERVLDIAFPLGLYFTVPE